MTVRIDDSALPSHEILKRLTRYYAVNIDLRLRDVYRQLLQKLGNPHLNLPPVIHVAGTNGKGSTLAFMRAMLEAAGYRVHAYTSPHLVSFHERIRLAGELISEEQLCDVLLECENANAGAPVTLFEITTAAAFLAFSRTPADVVLLEVGLGGRLDATNVIDAPIATVITRISYDHREFLGNTLEAISAEKAGIFKRGVPAIIAPQACTSVMDTLKACAEKTGTPIYYDWSYKIVDDGFVFNETYFPKPNLIGTHQYANAATAIATLKKQTRFMISDDAMRAGLQNAAWPARLQRLTSGALTVQLPAGTELWIDGGHNDSAGEVLADWASHDSKPLHVIYGMLNTKDPQEFLKPLARYIYSITGIAIPDEPKSLSTDALQNAARQIGIHHAHGATNVNEALTDILGKNHTPIRVLITGSLYLAGYILKENSKNS